MASIISLIFALIAGALFISGMKKRIVFMPCGAFFLLTLALIISYPGIMTAIAALIAAGGASLFFLGYFGRKSGMKILGIVLVLFGIIFFCVTRVAAPSSQKVLGNKNFQYDLIQYEKLGQYARTKYAGKRIAVLIPENPTENRKACLESFKKAFGGDVAVYYDRSASALEKNEQYTVADMLEPVENCDVLLMISSIPGKKADTLKFLNTVKQILLLPSGRAGDTTVLRPFFQDGVIGAIVLNNVNFSMKEDIPGSNAAAFDFRYLLVTPENIDSIAESSNYKYLLNEEEESEPDSDADSGEE